MSEFQSGRVAAIHAVGVRIDDMLDVYEREQADHAAMVKAFMMSVKCLEDYSQAMQRELEEAKLTIKEAEMGKAYISRCTELIRQLAIEADARRLQTVGAANAIKMTVQSVKRLYDDETAKLVQHEEFEKDPSDPINRPVGAEVPLVKVRQKRKPKS